MNAKNWCAVLLALGTLGCGASGPKTYPVVGRVEVATGDVSVLAGSHVEGMLEDDPHVRASGEIQADGTFRFQTQHAGAILKGAQEGRYQVRLILGDDDAQLKRKARAAVADRLLSFPTSGLTLQVPVEGEVVLRLAPRERR